MGKSILTILFYSSFFCFLNASDQKITDSGSDDLSLMSVHIVASEKGEINSNDDDEGSDFDMPASKCETARPLNNTIPANVDLVDAGKETHTEEKHVVREAMSTSSNKVSDDNDSSSFASGEFYDVNHIKPTPQLRLNLSTLQATSLPFLRVQSTAQGMLPAVVLIENDANQSLPVFGGSMNAVDYIRRLEAGESPLSYKFYMEDVAGKSKKPKPILHFTQAGLSQSYEGSLSEDCSIVFNMPFMAFYCSKEALAVIRFFEKSLTHIQASNNCYSFVRFYRFFHEKAVNDVDKKEDVLKGGCDYFCMKGRELLCQQYVQTIFNAKNLKISLPSGHEFLVRLMLVEMGGS